MQGITTVGLITARLAGFLALGWAVGLSLGLVASLVAMSRTGGPVADELTELAARAALMGWEPS